MVVPPTSACDLLLRRKKKKRCECCVLIRRLSRPHAPLTRSPKRLIKKKSKEKQKSVFDT
jgi:hypothetical protein